MNTADRPHWSPASHWDDHPDHATEDWKSEVMNGDTRQGYIDWVNSQIEVTVVAQ